MIRRLALIALCCVACGKETFLAAAFVQTPSLPNPVDPSGNIPPFQVITAYLGTIDTTDPTKIDPGKEAPITDAIASVSFMHGGTDPRWLESGWTQSDGTYTLSSKDEPLLTFEPGTPYTLVLETKDGDAFGARFTPGPAIDIQEFVGSTCTIALPPPLPPYNAPRCHDGSLSGITRTDAAVNGTFSPAFVIVGRIDPNNPSAEPQITYKFMPQSADELLKYVLSDRPYRLQKFDIPASAYPQSGYYLVTLLSIKQGKVSSNAFLGSTALAGTGVAGIVHVP
ncbi:MAG: hypothetical protein ABR567_08545 [Myxococcales bacterium]|nr:hypothetical protein [Myxococcales bacterium]